MNDTTTAEAPGTALTVIERASLALGAAEHEKKLIELAKQSTEIVAITNQAGYQQCHAARMALKNERINIEKLAKTARDDATKFSKAVIAEEKRLIGLIEPEETRLQAIQDAHDAEVERRKAEAARIERERVERIQAGIRDIKGALIDVAGRASSAIEEKIRELVAFDISAATCQEFAAEAETARTDTLARLREMHVNVVRQEAEAAELKAAREDLERRQAEQAERERQEQERAAAAQRQREEEEAARRRAIEEEERASRARIEEQERKARALREQADREAEALRQAEAERLRAAQEKIDAERRELEDKQRAEREATEARERDERLAQEQREREERDRAEAAQREIEAAAQRERDAEAERQREVARKATELLDGRELLVTFKGRFGHREEFAGVVKAIDIFLSGAPSKSRAKRIAAQTT